ncbi:hypothetical protein ACOME3_006248 [Neoechinorhynchus agilis]
MKIESENMKQEAMVHIVRETNGCLWGMDMLKLFRMALPLSVTIRKIETIQEAMDQMIREFRELFVEKTTSIKDYRVTLPISEDCSLLGHYRTW